MNKEFLGLFGRALKEMKGLETLGLQTYLNDVLAGELGEILAELKEFEL